MRAVHNRLIKTALSLLQKPLCYIGDSAEIAATNRCTTDVYDLVVVRGEALPSGTAELIRNSYREMLSLAANRIFARDCAHAGGHNNCRNLRLRKITASHVCTFPLFALHRNKAQQPGQGQRGRNHSNRTRTHAEEGQAKRSGQAERSGEGGLKGLPDYDTTQHVSAHMPKKTAARPSAAKKKRLGSLPRLRRRRRVDMSIDSNSPKVLRRED
jgi:hypothetical protein